MKERVEVMYEGDDLESILKQVEQIDLAGATFKVIFVKINDLVGENKIEYGERRLIERDLGMHIEGEADVRNRACIRDCSSWRTLVLRALCRKRTSLVSSHKNRIVIRHLLAHVLRDQLQISLYQIRKSTSN